MATPQTQTAKPNGSKSGRKPMTDAEKKARKERLAAESKSDRFRRVVTPRVNRAIKALNGVAACTGGRYEYTEAQRDKILEAIGAAANNVRTKLLQEKTDAPSGFTL